MAILTLKSRYPFDPSGNDTVNFVGGERHELSVKGNRIIVPKQGAFYRRSLVVQRDGNEVLKEGVDYFLGGFYQEATAETGLEVNVVIVFDDRIQGNVYLSYQVVGGLYSGIFETIDEFIQALLVDPRKTRWDDILDKPEFYAPMPHLHDINDVYGMDYIIPVLEEIARSIRYLRHREFRKVYNAIAVVRNDMEFRIDGLSDEVKENNRQLADTILNLRSTINNVNKNKKDIEALRKLIPVNLIERVKTAETDIVGLKANINTIDNQLTDILVSLSTLKTKSQSYDEIVEIINNIYDKKKKLVKGNKIDIAPNTNYDKSILKTDSNGQLYVTSRAPNEVIIIYVDAENGVDEKDRGRSKKTPLRTVKEALKQYLRNDVITEINIKEGQTHYLPSISETERPYEIRRGLYLKSYRDKDSMQTPGVNTTLVLGGGVNGEYQSGYIINSYRSASDSYMTKKTASNILFRVDNNAFIVFNNTSIKLNSPPIGKVVNGHYESAFQSAFIVPNRTASGQKISVGIINGNTYSIIFKDENQLLIHPTVSSKVSIALSDGFFNKRVNQTIFQGQGRIVEPLGSNVEIYLCNLADYQRTNENNDIFTSGTLLNVFPREDTSIGSHYSAKHFDVERFTSCFPGARTTLTNLLGGIVTNVDASILPFADISLEGKRNIVSHLKELFKSAENIALGEEHPETVKKINNINQDIQSINTRLTNAANQEAANKQTINNQQTTLNDYGNRIRNLESRQNLTAQDYSATGNGLTSPTDSKWKSECWGQGKVVKLIDGEAWIGAVNLGNIKFRSSVSGVASDKMKTRMFFDGEYLTVDKKLKATDFNMTSDIRLKENIEKITQPLEKVSQLNGYTFNFLHDEQRSGGVIAQELIEVLPELVTKDDEGILSVKYNGLIALLIESVKALKNKNNELEEKLNQLLTKD